MIEEAYQIISTGGIRLHSNSWVPQKETKAVVCLVHGLGYHMDAYQNLTGLFEESGIAYFSFDLRGHGLSEGKKGHGTVVQFLDDIQELVISARKEFTELPIFLMGIGMGGTLVINYLLKLISSEIKGVIIHDPWLEIPKESLELSDNAASILHKLIPTLSVSHKLLRTSAVENDKLTHNKVSLQLFYDLKNAGFFALQNAGLIEIPMLVSTTESNICSSDICQELAIHAGENADYKLWHNIENSMLKEDMVRFFNQWINGHSQEALK